MQLRDYDALDLPVSVLRFTNRADGPASASARANTPSCTAAPPRARPARSRRPRRSVAARPWRRLTHQTGVPALAAHIKGAYCSADTTLTGSGLTLAPRQQRIQAVLRDIRGLLNASTLYLSSTGLGATESESIRVAVTAELTTGRKSPDETVSKVHLSNLDRIDNRIGDPLAVGVDNAKRSALPTLRDFQAGLQSVLTG